MKKVLLVIACLLLSSAYVAAQSRGPETLRGLKGVRLVIMYGRADALDEAQRPVVLKLLEGDSRTKFKEAGIPLLQFAQEIEAAGSPQLIVYVTLDKPNGFVYPVVIESKLFQRARLTRDPAMEVDVETWESHGIGAPKLNVETIRSLLATEVDQFIKDFMAVNPK